VIHRLALVLAATAAVAVLPGCGWLLGPSIGESGEANVSTEEEAAAANVRASIPAMEAYYADNLSYAGATVDVLRGYDHGIGDILVVPSADGQSYCISSTVGSATMSKHGPVADLQAGGC
jgi:hypothetical protein